MKLTIEGNNINITLNDGSVFEVCGDKVAATTDMENHELINALRATKEVVSTMRDIHEILSPSELYMKTGDVGEELSNFKSNRLDGNKNDSPTDR